MSAIEQTPIVNLEKKVRLPPKKKTQSKELLKRIPFLQLKESSNKIASESGEKVSRVQHRAPVFAAFPVTNNTNENNTKVSKLQLGSSTTDSSQETESG